MKCAYPPARSLIDKGARVALATDFNPGSSPTQDLSLVGLLARLYMKMTLPEVMSAFTIGGAYALGEESRKGALVAGYRADFIVSAVEWRGLFYQAGNNPIIKVFKS
jgi:imidazolonepropionase